MQLVKVRGKQAQAILNDLLEKQSMPPTILLEGTPGPQGEAGQDGKDGRDGSDGKDGTRGPRGLQGVRGATGASGLPGEPGMQGRPGAKGDQGEPGEPGPRGQKGKAGKDGTQGIIIKRGGGGGGLGLQPSPTLVFNFGTTDVWVIKHNLNGFPAVTTVDTSGDEIQGEVVYTDSNTITVTFLVGIAGKAFIT